MEMNSQTEKENKDADNKHTHAKIHHIQVASTSASMDTFLDHCQQNQHISS
jgi:hypothetical protein